LAINNETVFGLKFLAEFPMFLPLEHLRLFGPH